MATITNLENVIKLYREEKITKYVLEKELTNSLDDPFNSFVKIEDTLSKSTGITYFMAVVPKKINGRFQTGYYIDPALFNICTAEEIIENFFRTTKTTPKAIAFYSRLLINSADGIIDSRESLVLMLSIYRLCLAAIKPELYTKLVNSKQLVRIENIQRMIDELNDFSVRLEITIERLNILGILPSMYIDAASELTKSTKIKDLIPSFLDLNPEEPSKNVMRAEIDKISHDPFNGIKHQEIKHDYKPETNQ